MAKKKKKKKTAGARKPTYAKGRKVEPKKKGKAATAAARRTSGAPARTSDTKAAASKPGEKGSKSEQQPAQWNLIKAGTLEMKVFLAIVAIVILATLVSYPAFNYSTSQQYKDLMKTYAKDLKKYEAFEKQKKEYDKQLEAWKKAKPQDPVAQKEYDKTKPKPPKDVAEPQKPVKPTFSTFLMSYFLFAVLEGVVFTFMGLNAQRRTDLKTPILDDFLSREGEPRQLVNLLAWSIPFGVLAVVPLVAPAAVAKATGLITGGETQATSMPLWRDALNSMSVGMRYEIMFLLLLMSVMVWVSVRYRSRIRIEPHLAGMVATFALTFLYLWFIGRAQGGNSSELLLTAATMAVSLAGVLGYLYWKKGLEYSLLAGAIGFGVYYPFLVSLIVR